MNLQTTQAIATTRHAIPAAAKTGVLSGGGGGGGGGGGSGGVSQRLPDQPPAHTQVFLSASQTPWVPRVVPSCHEPQSLLWEHAAMLSRARWQ